MLNLNLVYLRGDTSSSTMSYYGYNNNPSALDTDATWLIRKVDIGRTYYPSGFESYESKWSDRASCFISPSVPSLTYSINSGTTSLYVSWSGVTGSSRYNVLVTDLNNYVINYFDNATWNTRNPNPVLLVNKTNFVLSGIYTGNTYSVSVSSINVAGASTSTIYIKT